MNARKDAAVDAPGHPGVLAGLWGDRLRVSALCEVVDPAGVASLAPPATDRELWESADPATVEPMVAEAEREAMTPWPQPLASQFARYWRDGNRTAYEGQVSARQARLTRAVIRAAVTLDDEAIDAVADGIVLLCEQTTWAWAAHDPCHDEAGFVTPLSPYLDLGAGEVAGQLAWADHVLGAALDARYPGVRQRIRREVDARVFTPFETVHDYHWLGLTGRVHNWNAWIHGNVIAAAILLVDDPERRARLIRQAVLGFDRYVSALAADGAIDEGSSYWWEGAARALECLEVLQAATGGVLDAHGLPVLREVARFPQRMHIAGPWYVAVGDGSPRPAPGQADILWRWGRAAGCSDVVAYAASLRRLGEPVARSNAGLGRVLRALGDPSWVACPGGPELLDPGCWLPSVEVLTVRGTAGPDGLFLVAKGGHNGENHNHLDVGEVVVAADGVPVVIDPGRPTYDARTFSPRRYELWVMQSGWHTVPAPRGLDQGVGEPYGASDVRRVEGGLSMELREVYGLGADESWRREAVLAAGIVRITDTWRLAGGGSRTTWMLAGEAERDGEAVVIRPLGDAKPVRMTWRGATFGSLERRDLGDPMLAEPWEGTVTRLVLNHEGPAGRSVVEVGR